MPAKIQKLLNEFKTRLSDLYGQRLKGVYLFGSYARGDYDKNSDVDVLIVLDSYESYWKELVRSAQAASEISLAYNVTISRTILSEEQWQNADWPVLRNIRLEGVAA